MRVIIIKDKRHLRAYTHMFHQHQTIKRTRTLAQNISITCDDALQVCLPGGGSSYTLQRVGRSVNDVHSSYLCSVHFNLLYNTTNFKLHCWCHCCPVLLLRLLFISTQITINKPVKQTMFAMACCQFDPVRSTWRSFHRRGYNTANAQPQPYTKKLFSLLEQPNSREKQWPQPKISRRLVQCCVRRFMNVRTAGHNRRYASKTWCETDGSTTESRLAGSSMMTVAGWLADWLGVVRKATESRTAPRIHTHRSDFHLPFLVLADCFALLFCRLGAAAGRGLFFFSSVKTMWKTSDPHCVYICACLQMVVEGDDGGDLVAIRYATQQTHCKIFWHTHANINSAPDKYPPTSQSSSWTRMGLINLC